jgi:hypothetical protein
MNKEEQKRIQEYEEMLKQMNEFAATAKLLLREKAKRELPDYVRELLK